MAEEKKCALCNREFTGEGQVCPFCVEFSAKDAERIKKIKEFASKCYLEGFQEGCKHARKEMR
jgi:hypothetical protein